MRIDSKKAFTLIELVVVVAVLAVLAGVLVPRFSDHMAASRDAGRLRDAEMIRSAVEQYRMDKGAYPLASQNEAYGGWDVSHDGSFLHTLVEHGYLSDDPGDPINDENFHYRYFLYPEGSYECMGTGEFFVLGIRNFESMEFVDKHNGYFRCANRDWGAEFAFVTGGGVSFKN